MPVTSVSLSTPSVPGPSAPIILSYRSGRPTTFQVTASSSVAIGDFTVPTTLADLSNTQLFSKSSIYPPVGSTGLVASSVAIWSGLSSTPYTTVPTTGSIAIHFQSSQIFPDGINFQSAVARGRYPVVQHRVVIALAGLVRYVLGRRLIVSVNYSITEINTRLQGTVQSIGQAGNGFLKLQSASGATVSSIQLNNPCGVVSNGVLVFSGQFNRPVSGRWNGR